MDMIIDMLSGFSILIAGIVAIARFRTIGRVYYPFIFLIWTACANEILSYLLVHTGHQTNVNNNIYSLAEAILFSFFFRNLGVFDRLSTLFILLVTMLTVTWCLESFLLREITSLSSWFRILYSFAIVLMSITAINQLIFLDINKPIEINNKPILMNSVFLICVGSIVFFTLDVLVEIFWQYGINVGREFRIKIFDIIVYVNIAVNLLFALAVLWVPRKQPYTNLF